MNFEELVGLAISRLGLNVFEFYDLSPLEFKHAIKFTNEKEIDSFRTQYETSRYIAYHIWNSAGKSLKGTGLKQVKDVGLFEWEIQKETDRVLGRTQTMDEIKQEVLRIADMHSKK